jgi:hypothetical protein
MSKYLLLIHSDEIAWANADEALRTRISEGHMAFGRDNEKAVLGGAELQPTSTATTVRPDGSGGFLVTDGAYAETKEALGGYYLVEAADLDQALALAKQVPMTDGGIEVRPIVERG